MNRQFAAQAEARGEFRHAVAAVERARDARPNDRDIAAEYERVRSKMLPAVTVISVQAGASYATDRREVGNSSPRQRKDGILDAAVSIKDERTIGGTRWRSQIVAAEQLDRYTSELTRGRIAASTGPVIMLSRDVWLHLAPGGAAVWLDGHRLYDEASAVVVA